MSKLKLEDAERLVQEVITEKGEDFVYEPPESDITCVNWTEDDNGKRVPSCLVGQVLAKIEVLDELTPCQEAAGAEETCEPFFELDAITYLNQVQELQDSGTRYGDLPTTYTDMFTD